MHAIFRAWGRILSGYNPFLSIEITSECPLRCPGCYAYGADHLGGDVVLREFQDLRGDQLIEGILNVVKKNKPLHVTLVGGEPLVRYRELNSLLPKLSALNVHTQVVTSAVRRIPLEWSKISQLQISVSIDGLAEEHDRRRAPATYDRILKNIEGHRITVHCTVTHQQLQKPGYLEEFVKFWSAIPATEKIWISLFTPQIGESSEEMLTPEDRRMAVEEMRRLNRIYPKLKVPDEVLELYMSPPASPKECTFSRVTTCLSPDLKKQITPCQFGGKPDCQNCGCMASAAMGAVARRKVPGGIRAGSLFTISSAIGRGASQIRKAFNGRS